MLGSEDFLEYYKRELVYLRDQGAAFARRYPKVAGRLAIAGMAESPDPHVERLIEANAFLAARVHRDLDREFPRVAASLLDHLCPSLTQPIPSMTIVQMRLDPTQGKVTSGYGVPRHTGLVVRSAGETCRFRTAWQSTLWPLSVSRAWLAEGAVLCIRIECDPGNSLGELELDRLQLHLHGDWMSTMPLYEQLLVGIASLAVVDSEGQRRSLPTSHWSEVGFGEGEDVLPNPPHAQPAYGLLQEYFAFPRKFHFFEVRGLRGLLGSGTSFELQIRLDRGVRSLRGLSADAFRLNCVPVVNLFPLTTEPVVIDGRHFEYPLVADRQRETTTGIHSILSVVASDPDADRPHLVRPFAACDPEDAADGQGGPFWWGRREPSLRADLPGTDMFLSFVDGAHDAAKATDTTSDPVVWARVLCTNRRLAEQVTAGTVFRAEGVAGAIHIRALYEATPERDPPLAGDALWRLVALLRLNHQSLVAADNGPRALREMLSIFATDSARDLAQVRGVAGLAARTVTSRIGSDAWRGFCRGTEVSLQFDEDAFVGGSPLLLSAVLARFFALYTTVNSFVRLVVRRRDEVWKQWEPLSGRQCLV